MMSEEIDVLIERKEAELLPFCSRMEELKTEFIKETVRFAADWYKKTAKQYVTKYPEIILSLSEEKVAKMKDRVDELVRNTERIVKGVLDNPPLWWHQNQHLNESIEQYKQIADKSPVILDRAVRQSLGYLGVILEEFGFHVTTSGNTGKYQEFWFVRLPDTKLIVPCYPHLLSWTEEMQDTVREYDSQFTKAIALYNQIHQLKEEKKREDALKRWDAT